MDETGVLHKIIQYGQYLVVGLLGWFMRRYMERSDMKEREQDIKLDALDKRIDSHDVSRAEMKTQLTNIHSTLTKIDKKIDDLLTKK